MIFSILLLSLCLLLPVYSNAAADFDGVDDAGTGVALSNFYTTSAKTLMVRFKASAGPGSAGASCQTSTNHHVAGATAPTIRFAITLRSTTQYCGFHYDGVMDQITRNTTSVVGNNVHIALVHSGGNIDLYYDGVLQAGSVASGNTDALTQLFAVGNAGATAFAGRIHHIAVYNVAVPAAEIAVIASSRRLHLRKTLPTGEWSFGDCAVGATATGTFRDTSFNSRPLTVVGAPICVGHNLMSYPGGLQ